MKVVKEIFKKKKFSVEHVLSLYADSFALFPMQAIYEIENLTEVLPAIQNCHIYLAGFVPAIDFVGARQAGTNLVTSHMIREKRIDLIWPMPEGSFLKKDEEFFYVENAEGKRTWPSDEDIQKRLNFEKHAVDFNIKYVGQAFGKDGSRNALDRILKHETLQKISILGVPAGYNFYALLLDIQAGTSIITVINPHARDRSRTKERLSAGIDKLYGTSEQERIALFEASLIRYFSPQFNKEFKDSFPSTNLNVLRDCYAKDFSAITAEICIDELPFRLFSDAVEARQYHFINHDLHKTEDRRLFFSV